MDVMMLSDISYYCLVEFIPGNLYRFRHNDSVQRYNRDIRGASSDIDDHMTVRHRNIYARTDRRRNRLFDEVRLFRARLRRGIDNGALLDLRYPRRYTDNNARLEKHGSARAPYEILYHSESDLILAYNTVPERSYSDYIARSPSEHLLCFPSDLQYPVSVFIYCNHGRLPQNDAFAFHINKHRRCSEVDSYVLAHLASVKIIHLPHLCGRHTNS